MSLSITILFGISAVILQVVPSALSETTPSIIDIAQALQSIIEDFEFVTDDASTAETAEYDVDPRLNQAYKVLVDKLGEKMPTLYEMRLPSLGNSSEALYVEDIVIYGANNTYFSMYDPGSSFDIENITISIPYLEIKAQKYIMDNFNLNNMVVLSGEGPLRIRLENIFLHCKLLVKFQSLKFSVKHVPILELALSNAVLDFKNLGNGGYELEKMLNSIATDCLPFIIAALNHDIQLAQQDPAVWATMEPTFNELFTTILNTLKASL